jgi:hypothetical protein
MGSHSKKPVADALASDHHWRELAKVVPEAKYAAVTAREWPARECKRVGLAMWGFGSKSTAQKNRIDEPPETETLKSQDGPPLPK